jgi:hypothetical protein
MGEVAHSLSNVLSSYEYMPTAENPFDYLNEDMDSDDPRASYYPFTFPLYYHDSGRVRMSVCTGLLVALRASTLTVENATDFWKGPINSILVPGWYDCF